MGYNEEKQRQLDMRYLRMARIWAENSYCVRRKVGALIVKDKMIISDGYNGTPSGFENVCEDENGKTKPPETLFFINNQKSEVMENDIFGYKSMCAYHNVNFPASQAADDLLLL